MRRLSAFTVVLATGLSFSGTAAAFSTRVHILIANDLRDALIASGKNRIPLRFGPHSVELTNDDTQALVDHPLEFRAGAIGPDNMMFPALTDPSHAVGQRPYEQCQLLYDEAILGEERAYAIGCFLHGATDAIAHHTVNFLTGETFTLTPLTSARTKSWDNVVRHIVAETMFQDAAYGARPDAFATGKLEHRIPKSFVLRAYLATESPLWQLMASRAQAELDAAFAANPGASLPTVLASANLAPADHLVLAPVYLEKIDGERVALEQSVAASIADLQNPASADGAVLGVGPGQDAALGTSDDTTACSVSCASLYAKYRVYVSLLEPRYDAGQNPLPSAFDKISDKLRNDLFAFLPAYLDSVENLSARLNLQLQPGAEPLDLSATELEQMFAPMTDWADGLTAIDYQTLSQSVLPGWIIDLQNALNAIGINIQVPDIIEALFQPIIQPIKDAVKAYAVDLAKQTVGELVDAYHAEAAGIEAEFSARLDATAPAGLGGNLLDHFFDSGLYGHSYNAAAAAFANHAVVLPVGDDPIGVGPATFDASHTPSWMQLGVCPWLREMVFPLGIDVAGSLGVDDGTRYAAVSDDDSPVECHDGSLSAFTSSPAVASCGVVSLDELLADVSHRGSLSRAHPPEYGAATVSCSDLDVPGLPPASGAGGGAGSSGSGAGGAAGAGATAGSAGDSVAPVVPGVTPGSDDAGGCGCRAARTDRATAAWLATAAILVLGARRARRAQRARGR